MFETDPNFNFHLIKLNKCDVNNGNGRLQEIKLKSKILN